MSPPKAIIANTAAALQDLEEQLRQLRTENSHIGETNARVPGEVWSVRIDSGSFHVPWEETKRLLEAGGVDMVVVRPQVEVKEKLTAQGCKKRRSAADPKGNREKRLDSEKAAKAEKVAEASKGDPIRRKALRSRNEE